MSDVTAKLIDLLRSRDANGLAKYGVTLDRTDLTQEQWCQHAIEEMLDAAGYLESLKRGFDKTRAAQAASQPSPATEVEYVSVTELAARHSNLREYLSQLEDAVPCELCGTPLRDQRGCGVCYSCHRKTTDELTQLHTRVGHLEGTLIGVQGQVNDPGLRERIEAALGSWQAPLS